MQSTKEIETLPPFAETCVECMHEPHFAGCKTGQIASWRERAIRAEEEVVLLRAVASAARDLCEAKMWEDEELEQTAGDAMAEALNAIADATKTNA